ncbi:MAG: transporter [Acidobacteriota bacterium]|nr:transporter [Acidobacteriota bacterium]
MKRRLVQPHLVLSLLFLLPLLYANSAHAQTDSLSAPTKRDPPPIQDNSFLVEEAYNQEAGVVQHINTFTRQRGGDWLYTFTQEWPVISQKHQLGFTLPVQRIGGVPASGRGIGDVALNYRYQLVGSGETTVALAPRFSLLLPSGDERRGLGTGSFGMQFNLPVSAALSPNLVTHWNAGATHTPSATNALGEKAHTTDYNLGQSFVWLAAPTFNVLIETAWNSPQTVTGPRQTRREYELLLNPGVRWAHNFRNGLQIVPGLAVPIGVGPSRGERGVFFYLSFEHPFRKQVE